MHVSNIARSNFVGISIVISVLSVMLFLQIDDNVAFGFEENILPLQTGIISTANQDYAISQDFEARIFQNGKIMRLSGITTTGEEYYLYQKTVGDDVVVKGKILVNNEFVPILFKEEYLEQKTETSDAKITMAVKLSSYTYSNYPFVISVKVFDSEINPNARYDSRLGTLDSVSVNVVISDKEGNHISTLSGQTDSTGVFQDKYLVLEDVVDQGEYDVVVTVDNNGSMISESFTTFFRGDIRNYFHNTN